MPEGPELCLNSLFVNSVSSGRLFKGKVVKSAVSKCSDVDFVSDAYTISSEARGKEVALTLQCTLDPQNKLRLLFRFGMSGKFRFCPLKELPKHAHLQFFTKTSRGGKGKGESSDVLSFVDVRRFGSWHVMPEGWGENRGPDPMLEYDAFRRNVLEHLDDSAFNRPICEALLNQKYFNGIGNYLRAEILFRVSVPPFTCARKVLEPLSECGGEIGKGKPDSKKDILWFCHKLPQEVVDLKQKLGKSETAAVTDEDYMAFCQWLKCYENPGMNTTKDHNGRTVWFKGVAGPMCHKNQTIIKGPRKSKRRAPGGTVYKTDSELEEAKQAATAVQEGEELEKVRKGRTRRMGVAVKQQSEQSGSVIVKKEDVSESDVELVDTSSRRGTKRKQRAAKEPSTAKRSRTRGREDLTEAKRRETKAKQCAYAILPTRRSSRIKNAELKK